MDNKIQINPIGKVKANRGEFAIVLNENMKHGLTDLDGYSHMQVIWWGHLHDDLKNRNLLVID